MAFRRLAKAVRLARLRRDEDGVTIVEFALVLPPMLMVIMGGIDLSYQAYVQSVLQGSLNDIARSSSMETPTLSCNEGTLEERVGCAIKARSDVVARRATYDIEVKSFYDFSGVGRAEKLVTDYNSNGRYDPGDCFADHNRNGTFDQNAGASGVGGADDVAFYKVDLTMPRLFPLQGLVGLSPNYELTAQMAIRNQPYARQATPPTVCI